MPIAQADIQYRLSGGAGNASANASIGGAKSSTVAPLNLFDKLTGPESAAGDVEYRCIYVHNGHATLTLENAVAWLPTNTPSPSTLIEIGVGSSAVNGVEQAAADEGSSPAGVSFAPAANKAGGIALGSIPPGQHRAIWYRRTVTPGAAAASNDAYLLRTEGETAA